MAESAREKQSRTLAAICSVALLVLTVACSSETSSPTTRVTAEPTANPQQFQISEITYELNVNWGIKETDKIILRNDGTAEYFANLGRALRSGYAKSRSEKKGSFHATLDPRQFDQLAALVVQRDFFSRKDRYSSSVADASTITTSIRYAGGRKTVVNYGGGGDDEVEEIQTAIISLAESIRWQQK
ncbi:MAG: hypothetical protein WAM70_16210 [Pyrinomonadaceae bacterium]